MSTHNTATSRRASKSQQRVRDILQAGRNVFAEKGYDAATSAEIAQRVGISEATVFSYFSGKRKLRARHRRLVRRNHRRIRNRPAARRLGCVSNSPSSSARICG